ncbi:MAG TPA: hypothetical protein VNG33_21175 [Polyangiaceae bacterium]|nr:hypothetical protein [Polyangiaceae bacterium]
MRQSVAVGLRAVCSTALLVATVGGCSRPSGNDPSSHAPASAATPGVRPPSQPVPAAPSSAVSAGPSPGLVLTPEDAEDAAEHRISEQNLESELDRLEREIQAE